MNKTDLIYSIAKRCDIPRKHSRKVVDIIIDHISTSLADGHQVQLLGFGNFETRERAQRKGRNPKTGKRLLYQQPDMLFLALVVSLKMP